jgi:hypothetical protein
MEQAQQQSNAQKPSSLPTTLNVKRAVMLA